MIASLSTPRSAVLSIASGILLYACFPPIDQPLLAWLALVPLLLGLRFVSYRHAFVLGSLTGLTLSSLHMRWLLVVPSVSAPAFIAIVMYGAAFFALFAVALVFVIRRTRLPMVLIAPTLWAAIEYLRSNLFFLAIPFGLLAYSQHDQLEVIQLASFASVWGVSFLIVLVNAGIAEILVWALGRYYGQTFLPTSSSTQAAIAGLMAFVALLTAIAWGGRQIRTLSTGGEEHLLRVSLIQGNIPQNEKWDPRFRDKIHQRYWELSLKAMKDQPQLIIWPESATPGYLNNPAIYRPVKQLAGEVSIPLLLGSAAQAKIRHGEVKQLKLRNSAFLIDAAGNVRFSYDKMRLLPFAEYVPLEGKLSWPRWLVPHRGRFIAGTEHRIFEVNEVRFGNVICWEVYFPDLVRRFVKRGAQFMVNLANEAWFGESEASRQFLSMAIFRAVENRVSLLRATNTGISVVVDPSGKIRGRVTDEAGKDILVTGLLTAAVPKQGKESFYTRYGDVFAFACGLVAFIGITLATLPSSFRRAFRLL